MRSSVEVAMRHARRQERQARQDGYSDGPAAFGVWAAALEPGHAAEPCWDFTDYYAAMNCASCCYARDYLQRIAMGDPGLLAASAAYGHAAVELKAVWRAFMRSKKPDEVTLFTVREHIRRAGGAVESAINGLAQCLVTPHRAPIPA